MYSKMFACISNVFHSSREIHAEIFSYDLEYDSYLIYIELRKISSICSNKFIVFCSRTIMKAGTRI